MGLGIPAISLRTIFFSRPMSETVLGETSTKGDFLIHVYCLGRPKCRRSSLWGSERPLLLVEPPINGRNWLIFNKGRDTRRREKFLTITEYTFRVSCHYYVFISLATAQFHSPKFCPTKNQEHRRERARMESRVVFGSKEHGRKSKILDRETSLFRKCTGGLGGLRKCPAEEERRNKIAVQ